METSGSSGPQQKKDLAPVKKVARTLREVGMAEYHHEFVKRAVVHSLDKPLSDRQPSRRPVAGPDVSTTFSLLWGPVAGSGLRLALATGSFLLEIDNAPSFMR